MNIFRKHISLLAVSFSLVAASLALAASIGTIDATSHYAGFVHAPTNQTGSDRINFGVFTTVPQYNITISDGSFHGYAWSPVAGWIVMNCANTNSGCSSTNQNFKVSVDSSGVVSGYAWGQQAGWINFGPFANNGTPQIKIAANGNFGGTTGTAGYAWSERYGWIIFDCSTSTNCVNTTYTAPGTVSGGGPAPMQPSAPTVPVTGTQTPVTIPAKPVSPAVPHVPSQAGSSLSTQPSGGPSVGGPQTTPPVTIIPSHGMPTEVQDVSSSTTPLDMMISFLMSIPAFMLAHLLWFLLLLLLLVLIGYRQTRSRE